MKKPFDPIADAALKARLAGEVAGDNLPEPIRLARHAVLQAQENLARLVHAEFTVGKEIKFKWMREQIIAARVTMVRHDSLQVELLEDATTGIERKGNKLWIALTSVMP